MAITNRENHLRFLIDQARRQRGEEMGGLANLIRSAEAYPEAGQAALSRFGIQAGPVDNRRDAALRQQMQLAAFREAIRGSRGTKGGLPSDLVGAIGTPDFRRHLQDAAGTLDRQSVDTLLDLDRKEREFQVKGVAKPGKLSPFAQKLREMEALGIPITEETVRGVYGNKEDVIDKGETTGGVFGFGGTKRPPRQISLSALAGLTGGEGPEAATVDEEGSATGTDDRRNRLRGRLFGGGGADY